MTETDVRKTFPEATEAQVQAILALRGAEDARLAALEAELETARQTIGTLEKDKAGAGALEAELEGYRRAEARRREAEEARQARQALENRFNAVVGERTFVHELVRQGVLDAFEKALAGNAGNGRDDAAIFDALTRDKDYFLSMNPPAAPDMGRVEGGFGADATARAVMGLPPRE